MKARKLAEELGVKPFVLIGASMDLEMWDVRLDEPLTAQQEQELREYLQKKDGNPPEGRT
jgi:hypothetical protein